MSIKVMSKIWESGPKLQSHRFVLLALADYANDDGECWPSINGIARKTCMTTRGVQKIMRHLEADGWVVVVPGAGRKNCNVYLIKTPNTVHPQEQPDPLNGVPGPLNVVPNTPEPGSPEPSVTVNRTIIPPIVPQGDENASLKADDTFERNAENLYNLYPRKIGKGAALKAIRKALKSADAEVLREAVGAYAAAVGRWPKEERQFVPHPSTWFNSRRWEDDRGEWERRPKPATNGLPTPHIPEIRFA
jgi:hypothetical protein